MNIMYKVFCLTALCLLGVFQCSGHVFVEGRDYHKLEIVEHPTAEQLEEIENRSKWIVIEDVLLSANGQEQVHELRVGNEPVDTYPLKPVLVLHNEGSGPASPDDGLIVYVLDILIAPEGVYDDIHQARKKDWIGFPPFGELQVKSTPYLDAGGTTEIDLGTYDAADQLNECAPSKGNLRFMGLRVRAYLFDYEMELESKIEKLVPVVRTSD